MKAPHGTSPLTGANQLSTRARDALSSKSPGVRKVNTRKPTRTLPQDSPTPQPREERRRGRARRRKIPGRYLVPRDYNTLRLSGIFFDLNLTCIAKSQRTAESSMAYGVDFIHASEFINIALSHAENRHLLSDIPPHRNPKEVWRLSYFANEFGWLTLAICAFSETFRRAFYTLSFEEWSELKKGIAQNAAGLNLFADMRGLGAEALLLERGIINDPIERHPERKDVRDHPHHWVIKLDGRTVEPLKYEGEYQENITENIFDREYWPRGVTRDPTLRKPQDGPCRLCHSPEPCNCTIQAHPLVELREYKGKGTGVRALTSFRKDEVLGQFLGELKPQDSNCDFKYSLIHGHDEMDKLKALISPKKFGNWTRFINHSCEPSTNFVKITVGKHTGMMVRATRDIAAFEEITVDYGSGYMENVRCKCGTQQCRQRLRQVM
ncbi:hypothetical protein FQN54_007064 [Arachnomyces sp. PD_36]|nr:hypothetical protein FQN54_007064 [Arachnomyces sp. PD_36]